MGGERDEPLFGEGAVKSLDADGLRRPSEAVSRTGSKSVLIGEDGGSVRGRCRRPRCFGESANHTQAVNS